MVKKIEPTTTVTGQKYKSVAISVITSVNTPEYKKILSVARSFFSMELTQKPCKKRKIEIRATPMHVTKILALIDMTALKRRKAVRKVNIKPIQRAARKRGIVLKLDTVKIFSVRHRTYIPTPNKMTTGSLAKILTGIRNQKIPTPRVKSGGKMRESRVGFIPNPSQRENINKINVRRVRPKIAGRRDESLIKLIPKNSRERKMDVAINFFSLEICICIHFLDVVVIFKVF